MADLFEDLTGHRPSAGTLLAHLDSLSNRLATVESVIKENLMQSDTVHADETGIHIGTRKEGLHTVTNAMWTFYDVHEKRGKAAMDAIGFLAGYTGVVVHDFWKSYFDADYHFTHALCGVHLLWECQGIMDYGDHQWAADIQILLREAWKESQKAWAANRPVDTAIIVSIENRCDAILSRGRKE